MSGANLLFYVDPTWRRDTAHVPLLFPFWGDSSSINTPFTRGAFSKHGYDASQYSVIDDIKNADVVLLPYRFDIATQRCPEVIEAAIAMARAYGKRGVIDSMGDREYEIPVAEAIVLKYGGYQFEKKDNEIILPPYADDLLERYCNGTLSLREKRDAPIIGFAGWITAPFTRRLYWSVKELPKRLHGLVRSRYGACKKGVFVRMDVVRALSDSHVVETNILARKGYSGNVKTAERDIETLRREFVENALESDICLDVRGDANNSTRLFEVLSLGRVPLIIDTERNFPFSDELDYRAFSIIVDFRDIKRLPEIARAAYDAISPVEWRAMQEKARAAYREWFRPDALTAHLIRAIRVRL